MSTRQPLRSRPESIQRLVRLLSRYWGVILILGLWQALVVMRQLNAIVLPRPSDVIVAIFNDPGLFLGNLWHTGWVALVGLAIGASVGTALAVIAWSSRFLSGMLTPLGLVFSSVPVVAMIPIIARILGYDIRTTLAIVAILTFFPFFVYVASGLRALPPGGEDVAAVTGTSRARFLRHIALPSAIPSWFTALRIAGPNAILAAMVAEFLMATPGLGLLLSESSEMLNNDVALGASLVATVVSVILFDVCRFLEARVHAEWQ